MKLSHQPNHPLVRLSVLSTKLLSTLFGVLLLLSCAGGGDGVGSGGTGIGNPVAPPPVALQLGTVTGFGSIIVEGNTYAEGSAVYKIEKDPAQLSNATASAAKLGSQVEVNYQSSNGIDQANTIKVRPTLIGNIESTFSTGFVAAGQRVSVETAGALSSRFDNFDRLSSLLAGNAVEVHGHRNAQDELVATRISLIDTAPINETKVIGKIVSIVNSNSASAGALANTTLRIGALQIVVNSNTLLVNTRGLGLAVNGLPNFVVGQRLSVYSKQAPSTTVSGTSLIASSLAFDEFDQSASTNAGTGGGTSSGNNTSPNDDIPSDTSSIRVGGVIREVVGGLASFKIGAVSIDASEAKLENGTVADLQAGKLARAKGTLSVNGNWRVLKAMELKFINNENEQKAELIGTISSFISRSSFRVRDTLVDGSATNLELSNGVIAMLDNDVLIKVEGVIRENRLTATRISFITSGNGGSGSSSGGASVSQVRAYSGTVSSLNLGQGSLEVGGVPVKLASQVSYVDNDGKAANASQLANGVRVTARGTITAGQFVATEIEFRDAASSQRVKITGGAYDIDLVLKRFKVNGQLVQFSTATDIDGDLSKLRIGRTVEVEGLIVSGLLVATKLKIDD